MVRFGMSNFVGGEGKATENEEKEINGGYEKINKGQKATFG